MKPTHSIDSLPVLARGKHRTPRTGACFMEFASYLAGERWSDHPPCTHPLLAALARHVNDCVSDDARQTLLELVPDVIGMTSKDLHVDLAIALRAATTALPVVAEERQRVLALAILKCERVSADLDGRRGAPMSLRSQSALASAPGAAAWARRHDFGGAPSRRVFRMQTGPAIVGYAVEGLAVACVRDTDRRLRDLLVGTIGDCRPYCTPNGSDLPDSARGAHAGAELLSGRQPSSSTT